MDERRADTSAPEPIFVRNLRRKDYAIGGQFHHDSEQLDQARVDIYDSDAEGGTFVHGGRIYMVWGHTTKPGETKQVDADVLALSSGGQWELVATLPMPLSSPAAAIIDGKLYVAGGSPGQSRVQADMWVRAAP